MTKDPASEPLSPEEFNLVAIWLRTDPARWIAGAFAGIFSAGVMWVATLLYEASSGGDVWFLLKAFAVPALGGGAMASGFHLHAILVGCVVLGLLAIILGVVYSHMTGTNRFIPLFGMGLTWGVFSWIFLNNLFSSSWREVYVLQIPKSHALFAWLIFGVSLVSVSFFDQLFRLSSSSR